MTFRYFASWSYPLAVLSVVAIAPVSATAAAPQVEAAIKTLAKVPANKTKFGAYCALLGDMEGLSDADEAKYDAIEAKLDAVIESYGQDVAQAWDTLSEVDPETDDGKAVAAAFEAMEGKCP